MKLQTPCEISHLAPRANGYRQVQIGNKMHGHHRVVFAAFHGIALAELHGKVIMHLCDNPGCVEPSHLAVGTQSENIKDMYAKGRDAGIRGSRHGNAKLTEQQVVEMRKRYYGPGKLRHIDLAKEFGVSETAVRKALTGQHWTHIA